MQDKCGKWHGNCCSITGDFSIDERPGVIQVSTEEILLTPQTAVHSASSRFTPRIDWSRIVLNVLLPLVGVIVALLLGAVMLVILKANPLAAYAALVHGVVG